MSNSLEWAGQLSRSDTVTAPFAYVPVAVVDPADIAAVAVTALTRDGHQQRAYRLTGPEAMTVGQRLEVLSGVLHRKLRLDAQADAAAHADMSARMPAEYVESFFDIFVRNAYDEGVVYDGVREVLGRDPRAYAGWAADHRGAFR
jgi:uncharacterized protein YbjT (DUF2867 family)